MGKPWVNQGLVAFHDWHFLGLVILVGLDFTVVQSASELQIDALETVGTGTGQGNAVILGVGES